jgi:hypothetical protein
VFLSRPRDPSIFSLFPRDTIVVHLLFGILAFGSEPVSSHRTCARMSLSVFRNARSPNIAHSMWSLLLARLPSGMLYGCHLDWPTGSSHHGPPSSLSTRSLFRAAIDDDDDDELGPQGFVTSEDSSRRLHMYVPKTGLSRLKHTGTCLVFLQVRNFVTNS